MARTVKEEEYNAKRSEILDVALRLVYSKGYQEMSIQDILDGLGISRGAFYHYFDSKQALLKALVERMGRVAEQILLPVVQDPHLNAIQKFRRYFEASARWKDAQKTLIVSLLRMWYTDENAMVRQKMTAESLHYSGRLLAPMIRQGIDEGVFTTPYPEQVAEIVAGVGLTVSDSIIGLLLTPQPGPETRQKLDLTLAAYIDTVERILGAPAGAFKDFEVEPATDWFDEMQAKE
jgi:AcrR family transcriptional regulator